MLDMAWVINSLLHALGVRADGVGVDRVIINYPELTSDKLSWSNSYTYVMRNTHIIIVIRSVLSSMNMVQLVLCT